MPDIQGMAGLMPGKAPGGDMMKFGVPDIMSVLGAMPQPEQPPQAAPMAPMAALNNPAAVSAALEAMARNLGRSPGYGGGHFGTDGGLMGRVPGIAGYR